MDRSEPMTMEPVMRRLAMGLGASLLAACTHVAPAAPGDATERSLAGTAWTIADIGGHAVTSARKTEVRFSEDRISGNAGCNSFGGGYTLAGRVMTATQVISTKMACVGPGMDQENAVFRIFGQPMTVTRQADGTLTLSDDAGTMTLRPER